MHLDYVEFYITNVCNLNCDRCNRFNNYAFSGHMCWQDHAHDYEQWSKIISIDRIGILGGEPMCHPDFFTWVTEVARLWPQSQIMIMTNGTYLSRYPDLYGFLQSWQGRVRVDVSRHNADHRESTLQDIERVFAEGFECFHINDDDEQARTGVKGYRSTDKDTRLEPIFDADDDPHIWTDRSWQRVYRSRAVTIRYADANIFDESVVRLDTSKKNLYLTSDMSDPDQAVDKCACKFSHHFLHGRLYKCGITAVLPEFVKQFSLSADASKINLIGSYTPAHWSWTPDALEIFLEGLQQGTSIAQCALCPDHFTSQQFAAGTKKLKIQKKSKLNINE